ncbi:inositol monophosphatase family protein [Pseudonocardia sp. T1-2H]|uniref:inositol monophosphatase family protein n=1 Tax=Pseudonocardia sp. T1-2H TaxID=3128899 RepID=UPI003100ADAC
MPEQISDTPAELAELRRVAELVACEAAARLRTLPAPRSTGADPGAVSTKSSPTDVVTAADKALEELVRGRLGELRPGEPVFGEEEAGDAAAARWVVDPIDGTVNYLYGLPWFAVSVAAVRDGVSLAGAVVEPASGRVWTAARGAGATLDGRALRVNEETELSQSLVGTGFGYAAERRARQARLVAGMLPRVRDVRRNGAASLDLCGVAAGWLDGYLEHGLGWWDWAAAALIAEEAGAVVRHPAPPTFAEGPDDGLGADATLVAVPGIARDLGALARELGAAQI